MALSQKLPQYRHHKASGQAYVRVSGRFIYLGKYGTAASRAEYDRVVGEYLANGRQLPNLSETTMVEIMAGYLKWAKRYYKNQPGGKRSSDLYLVKSLIKLIRPLYGRRPASDFSGLAVKSLMAQMVEAGKSRSYVNKQLQRMKHMLKWAVSEDLVSPDVYHRVAAVTGLRRGKTSAKEGKQVKPIGDPEINKTLKYLPPVVDDMVRFQRLTGARPGEIVTLRPMDLDCSQDIWRFIPESHKTERHGVQRVILIGPRAQEVLTPYLKDRAGELWCFSPKDSARMVRERRQGQRTTPVHYGNRPGSNKAKNPLRFPGLKYTTDSYRRAIHRACKTADVEKWSPNQIRHTAATSIREEFGLEAAQYVLGHTRADTTQIYAERNLKVAAEAIRKQG